MYKLLYFDFTEPSETNSPGKSVGPETPVNGFSNLSSDQICDKRCNGLPEQVIRQHGTLDVRAVAGETELQRRAMLVYLFSGGNRY